MEQTSLGGLWALAIVMIVVASWFFYRYVAPKSWREWKGAGLVQAFIVALYAEMYGFPLTLYLLSSVFGIDVPWLHANGHLWSFLIKRGTVAAMVEMLLGYTVIIAGIYLLARGWSEVYRGAKEGKLVTSGLYSLMRHPQYTGIFLVIIGQLIHWPTILTLLLSPLIFFVYFNLARKEERDMIAKFGDEYRNYAKSVPMFFPKIRDIKAFMKPDDSLYEA